MFGWREAGKGLEFGPENALNDGSGRYVIKSKGERKLNCRQQTESTHCGKDPRWLLCGKASAPGGALPTLWRRGRPHHRPVRVAADPVSALHRLRPHVRHARVTAGVSWPVHRVS